MKRFVIAGIFAALAGAVLAVVQDRRSRLDEAYEEDPTWIPASGPVRDAPEPSPAAVIGGDTEPRIAAVAAAERQPDEPAAAGSEADPVEPAPKAANGAVPASAKRRTRRAGGKGEPAS